MSRYRTTMKDLLEKVYKEDGHQDVSSSKRMCRTIVEDAQQIESKLNSMSPEDSLDTWWTNKLAVSANNLNKARDYIVNDIKEETEIEEISDKLKLKVLARKIQNMKDKAFKKTMSTIKSPLFADNEIEEGRMKDIFTADQEGKSAEEIAKIMKLPLKTVKSILGEATIKPYVSMQRDKATGKMNYVVLDKDEKEVFRSSDQRVATDYWKKNFDKLKESNYIDLKGRMTDSQIANIKKVWSGKTKADLTQGIKDMISKMDPITKLGIKQAKINVLSDLIEATMSPQMIATLKKEYEPMRGRKITAARARQLMNILDKLDDKNLDLLAKQNIPFVSSGSQSKLSVRKAMSRGVKISTMNYGGSGFYKEENTEEDFNEACWTGYKQVGMKDKGGKKVPNCVPEDNEIEEGKIKDIFTANKEGESMAQIAKRLKISLSTVKSVLGEAIEEADLSKSQIKKVHKVADDLPKKDFKDRYGKEKGDAVRYGTATNMVKKKLGMKEEKRLYVEMIAGLKKKAEKSGMSYGILKKVYDRGMAAWKGGHRPGASQQQWAFARVNSFITKSSGTWGGADKDLAAKVKGK